MAKKGKGKSSSKSSSSSKRSSAKSKASSRSSSSGKQSVAQRRASAKAAGQTMSQYKAANPSSGGRRNTSSPSRSSSSSASRGAAPSASRGGGSSRGTTMQNPGRSGAVGRGTFGQTTGAQTFGGGGGDDQMNYAGGSKNFNETTGQYNVKDMKVQERRDLAKRLGVSMGDLKSGNYGNGNGTELQGGFGGKDLYGQFRAGFNQGEFDQMVGNRWNDQLKNNPTSGLSKGPAFKGAVAGENGLILDGNAPMVIPKLGEHGFKAGDFAFDADGYKIHEENMYLKGQDMGAELTGRIAYVKKNGEVIPEFTGSHTNPNWDKYAESGSERMSSEGLYQDRYNVGYHGEGDMGDEYASTSNMGSIKSYFDDYNKGEKSFGEAYNQWAGTDRTEGYAGDVLKMVDQGKLKVSNDDYNMLVVDAKNYDWGKRGEIDGQGMGSYDARTGGRNAAQAASAAQITEARNQASAGYQPDYLQQTSDVYQQDQFQQQNDMNYDFSAFMPSQQGNKFQSFQGNNANNFSSGMNFNFDPMKFMQGQ